MIRLTALLLAFPVAAFAQDTAQIGQASWKGTRTTVTLQDTMAPGAVAEVSIFNVNVNQPRDDKGYPLTHNGLTVTVYFNVRLTGPDQFMVEVPDGYIALPEMVDVDEDAGAVILIFSGEDAGV